MIHLSTGLLIELMTKLEEVSTNRDYIYYYEVFYYVVDMELMVMLSLGKTRLEESRGALRSWRDNLLQALLPLVSNLPAAPNSVVSLSYVSTLLDRCIQLQAAILQRDQVHFHSLIGL